MVLITRRKTAPSEVPFLHGQIIQISVSSKPGGLDWSRRDRDRDLDLDAQKMLVSTVEKVSTVFKS
jgi:hypothetical protein